jgi:hypothetical protein
MDANEKEDYLELQDPSVKAFIAKCHAEYLEGRGQPAEELLARLRRQVLRKTKNRKRADP